MVMIPLKVSFGLKRSNCKISGAAKEAFKAYNIMVNRTGTHDLVQELLAYKVFHTQTGRKVSKMPKVKKGNKEEVIDKLVTLPFKFKEQASF
jgi:(p)ppGpp synthase/HD superfamily hydrolase